MLLSVAVDKDGVIGQQKGGMPWKCPTDLEMFRRLTMGRELWVGRKTYDGIGYILNDRKVNVLTNSPEEVNKKIKATRTKHEPVQTLPIPGDSEQTNSVVIGGKGAYESLIDARCVHRIMVTHIPLHTEPENPVFWPGLQKYEWRPVRKREIEVDIWGPDEHHFLPISLTEWVQKPEANETVTIKSHELESILDI